MPGGEFYRNEAGVINLKSYFFIPIHSWSFKYIDEKC